MAAEVKTIAELLALFADNTTGEISPEDFRSLVLTIEDLHGGGTGRIEATRWAARFGPGSPVPASEGPTSYLDFAVSDEAWYHITFPPDLDPESDVIIHVDWMPTGAEVGKTVSWDLDYLVMGDGAGELVNAADDTLSVADEAVPSTAWESAQTELTIPASAIVATDHEIHMRLERVASSAESGGIGVHHVWAEYQI